MGFKVNNERAVRFRKWANATVKDYTIKGWVMDEERLKNGVSIAQNYLAVDELYSLERIVSAYLGSGPAPYPDDDGGLGQAAGHFTDGG